MYLHTVLALLAQPQLGTIALIAVVTPTIMLLVLITITTLVALTAGADRGQRARSILCDLLAVLAPQRRGGRR